MKNLNYTEEMKFRYSGLEFQITNISDKKILFKNLKYPGSLDSMGKAAFEQLFISGKATFIKSYGDLPKLIATDWDFVCAKEMMFYQYLPIKFPESQVLQIEKRLNVFLSLIAKIVTDFKDTYGKEEFYNSYIYLTAKRQYVSKEKPMNRPGYHSDGFMTDDINYIWSDRNPTIFNSTRFNLTLDDQLSLKEMQEQALPENEVTYPNYSILRLDQFNIHKVNENVEEGMRTFIKISFSKDKYDLEGNSHNYELDYNWEMKPRKKSRNIPQSKF
ncbi:hypothetical protein CHRYSEOSP005_14690 [Chryseobacterium sp. Alg-005]|uniref:hypothetical protein n=1 Tax=Chryseobacterium sp. Alg-005 TaxID=3159516 RepID=UPI003555B22B